MPLTPNVEGAHGADSGQVLELVRVADYPYIPYLVTTKGHGDYYQGLTVLPK
jgi:hypothetical protein